jgi:type I restriction enzyme S subunit
MTKRKLKPRWQWVKFGDVVRQVKDRVDPKTSGLTRYIAGEHMDTDDLRLRRWGEIGDGYLGPAFHMRFKPGQVLYGSRRTYLRKVAVADFEGICANTTYVLESKDPRVLLPELLPFIMQTEAFNEHSVKQSKGSVNPYINFSDLAWYEFALPPLEEQRRMVAALMASTSVIENADECLTACELLMRRFILDEYSNATSCHEKIRIDEIGEISMGRQKAPKYRLGTRPRPFLKVVNIGNLELNLSDVEEMDFSERDQERYGLRPGDILLTEGDLVSAFNVGRPAVYEGEIEGCCFQNTLIRFRPSDRLKSYYGLLIFEGARLAGELAQVGKTTTVTHLGLGRFSELTIPIPPLLVQEETINSLRQLLAARISLRQRLLEGKQLHKCVLGEVLG